MFLILLFGLILIGVAVFRNRDNPSRLPIAALPGAALVLVYFLGGHIHFGAAASVLFGVILLASVAAATVMQVGKCIGRIPDIPSGTLAFAGMDMVVLQFVGAPSLAGWGGMLWSVAFFVWMVSAAVGYFTRPMVERRRREADAEIARMRAAEQTAAEGEGW